MQPPIPPDPPRNHNTQPLGGAPDPPTPPIPPASPYQPPNAPTPGVMEPAEEKSWALAAHLLPLTGLSFIAPLIIWLVQKDKSAFVAQHSLESLNFQIAVFIAAMVCIPLAFLCIGFILLPVIGIGAIVYQILAAVAASEGKSYVYPFSIRLIK